MNAKEAAERLIHLGNYAYSREREALDLAIAAPPSEGGGS